MNESTEPGGPYYVQYFNPGARRTERTCLWATLEEARESADILRYQGAKRVTIKTC